MARRRKIGCLAPHCKKEPCAGGLCEEHYEEKKREDARHNDAVHLLHSSHLDERILENPELRDELQRLQEWWRSICSTLNFRLNDPILGDEAQFAVSWCIALAQQIVDAEIAFRNGKPWDTYSLQITREWVWSNFRNLEAGFRSNGLPREN